MTITWKIKPFEELTTKELYGLLQLRLAVFSVEQNAPYQDADGKDFKALHLMGYDDSGELIAYARILPEGIAYKEISIGRVVSSQKVRGKGVGKELFKKALQATIQHYGNAPIRISAQSYLIKFYSGFGFKIVGEEYLEDSIPHTEMFRDA